MRLDERLDERDTVDAARRVYELVDRRKADRCAHVLRRVGALALRGDRDAGYEFFERGRDRRGGNAGERVNADFVAAIGLTRGSALAGPEARIELHAGCHRERGAHGRIGAKLGEPAAGKLHVIRIVRHVAEELHAGLRERLSRIEVVRLKLHDRVRRSGRGGDACGREIECLRCGIEDAAAQDQ